MNYIYFQTADNNSACYPVEAIRGFKQTAANTVTLFLNPIKLNEIVTTKTVDTLIINLIGGNIKARMQELAKFINQPASARESGFLVLGNDVSGKSFTSPTNFDNLGQYSITTGV